MKQATANQTHYLKDTVSGEGIMAFTSLGDGKVEVFVQGHPDLPGKAEVFGIEEARRIYRDAVKSCWAPE